MTIIAVEAAAAPPPLLAGSAELNSKHLERFEINCDMGEGIGRWKMGPDEELMPLIDTANVACGFHAGDYSTMKKTVKLAKKYGVKVGSHPGLPDLLGFGRRRMAISPEEIYDLVMYQTGALKAFLDAEGMPLNHIKPHGELYFYVVRDEEVMRAVLRAAKVFGVPVVGAKNAHYEKVAKEEGVDFIQEFYCDIDWDNEGNLVNVQMSRPKIPENIYDAIKLCGTTLCTTTVTNDSLNIGFGNNPFTVCLHSDMPTAIGNITLGRKAIDEVNQARGLSVRATVVN